MQGNGVSNHQIAHLREIIDNTGVIPAVDQIELHPLLTQKELLQFTRQHGIQLEAWRPLMRAIWIILSWRGCPGNTTGPSPRSCCAGIFKTAWWSSPNQCTRIESVESSRFSISNSARRIWPPLRTA